MIVSIDIETTGLDPKKHKVLEIAAVWFEAGVEQVVQCYVKQTEVFGNLYALNMNKKAIEQIVKGEGIEESEVADFFDSRLPDFYTIAGCNFANFDLRSLRKLGWEPNCYHRIIDVGNLYWRAIDGDQLPSMQTCLRRAGIPGNVKHTAIGDARDVLKLIRKYQNVKRFVEVK